MSNCTQIHIYMCNVFICTCQSAISYLKEYPDTYILTCVLCMRMSEMCILLVKFHIRWHFCLLSYDQHQDLPSLAKHEGHSSSVDQQLTTRSCTNIFWICSKIFPPNWLIFEIIHVMIQDDDNFLNWLKVMFGCVGNIWLCPLLC